MSIKVASEGLRPTPATQYPSPAARPLKSRLSTDKHTRMYYFYQPHWQVGMERLIREISGL
jgi:dTDP-4-dehydrorhamnose reductase